MESSIESVSIVSSTEALITFDDGETQVIRGIVTTAPVESLQNGVSTTRNMEPNTCAAGEPKIETTAMRGRENISPKTESVSTLSAGPDIRRNRFFYCAKASKSDRNRGGADNKHPTVKSTQLMRYLVKLITPPGGIVLDPFTGSGSTGVAAKEEGMDFIGIEQQPEYCEIARTRIGILQIPEENTNADPG
jgi:DNA modification methylase